MEYAFVGGLILITCIGVLWAMREDMANLLFSNFSGGGVTITTKNGTSTTSNFQIVRANVIASNGAEAIAKVFQSYLADPAHGGTAPASLTFTELEPYLVRDFGAVRDTTSVVDYHSNYDPNYQVDCRYWRCYKLPDGSVLYHNPADEFGGTDANYGFPILIDTDGKVSTGSEPVGAVRFLLYHDGTVRTMGNALANTMYNCRSVGMQYFGASSWADPDWVDPSRVSVITNSVAEAGGDGIDQKNPLY